MIASVVAATLALSAPILVQPSEGEVYEAQLVRTARDTDAFFAGSVCPNSKVEHIEREAVKILDHPDFAAAREHLRVTGCGRSIVHTISVGRTGGNPPWRMIAGLPGVSLAEASLMQSAFPAASAQTLADLPPGLCRTHTW